MGIGYDKSNVLMANFVGTIWKELKRMNSASLCSFDRASGRVLTTEIRDYIVGPDTAQASRQGTVLKHCAIDVFYRAEELKYGSGSHVENPDQHTP
jgi:hypothetical protein